MGGPSTWDQTKRNSLSVGDQDFHSVIESAGAYRVGGIGREIKLNIGLSSPSSRQAVWCVQSAHISRLPPSLTSRLIIIFPNISIF